eukprot:scpid110268/ scgid20086/ 
MSGSPVVFWLHFKQCFHYNSKQIIMPMTIPVNVTVLDYSDKTSYCQLVSARHKFARTTSDENWSGHDPESLNRSDSLGQTRYEDNNSHSIVPLIVQEESLSLQLPQCALLQQLHASQGMNARA